MPAAKGSSYADVLQRAIQDISANGYDSPERIAFWVTELKKAAEQTMASAAQVDQSIRDMLGQVYRRMIERGQIVQFHKGVGRFTVEKLRNQLRLELDRSILASINLIKINREKRIAETLQRFQGWATSIPKGGSKAVNRREEKEDLTKPVANLKFEQRRVEIDQSHKLIANLNRIIATDGGAIAAKWISHYRQPGYDYREDHKDRDFRVTGDIYLIRSSWAHRQGFVKPMSGVGYTDQISQPGEEINCRCFYEYIYNLRDLPDEMLTSQGKKVLAEAQQKIAGLIH